MLTPEQINVLGDRAADIVKPINDFLISDIARRVAGAGQLTSTAAYQIYRAQQLGMSREEIEKELQKRLNVSKKELEELLTQSAEVGYRFDLDRFPVEAVPFKENASLQQIVNAAVKLAQDDFTNLTQTLGMVAPDGKAYPLQKSYQKCMDYAFEKVITGAADYNTAIRQATKNLADKGVRTIDYASGVHTSLEAAVRRNVMGGLGLMQEKISEENHDKLGADGWEISAHAASAPDHEPIQGRQYPDKEYKKLNNSLIRRIGTLNCGHAAFPIILGVNSPMYTDEELEKFRKDNEEGVTYNGKHYTLYEATQKQRQIERKIRKQKSRILVDEVTEDADKLLSDRIRLVRYKEEYSRFSKATNLPTQHERAKVANFDYKKANTAAAEYKRVAKIADSMYDTGSTDDNINKWLKDKTKKENIESYVTQNIHNENDIAKLSEPQKISAQEAVKNAKRLSLNDLENFENWVSEYNKLNSNLILTKENFPNINEYTGGSYEGINAVERFEKGSREYERYDKSYGGIEKFREVSDGISKEISQFKNPCDLMVYRSVGGVSWITGKTSSVEDMLDSIGKIYTEKGFTSTTVCSDTMLPFGGIKDTKTKLEIFVPKETKGAYIYSISDSPAEFEYLIDKNTKFKITDAGIRKIAVKDFRGNERIEDERFMKLEVIIDD